PSTPSGRAHSHARRRADTGGRSVDGRREDPRDWRRVRRRPVLTATLVLVRHGEIIRPPYTSNFDRAPLSERGEKQIRGLCRAWPGDPPSMVVASPLRRSIESAIILASAFGRTISKRPCLKEWSADESGSRNPSTPLWRREPGRTSTSSRRARNPWPAPQSEVACASRKSRTTW